MRLNDSKGGTGGEEICPKLFFFFFLNKLSLGKGWRRKYTADTGDKYFKYIYEQVNALLLRLKTDLCDPVDLV